MMSWLQIKNHQNLKLLLLSSPALLMMLGATGIFGIPLQDRFVDAGQTFVLYRMKSRNLPLIPKKEEGYMAITKEQALARTKEIIDFDTPEEHQIDKALASRYRGISVPVDLSHLPLEEQTPILTKYKDKGWNLMKSNKEDRAVWIFD
jgi:hypothetical protein